MRESAITKIDFKVWNRKIDQSQRNFLHYLTQPEITRERPFELTDIECDRIKDEIESTESVEYHTALGINVRNVDDIEDF